MIEKIEGKLNMKSLEEKLNELVEIVNNLPAPRDRGPKSEHSMSAEDAQRVIGGDLAGESHKSAAETLGLSYGQIYSARKGFTFKEVHKEIRKAKKA